MVSYFWSYRFGLPIWRYDVGSLKDEILEGKTGLVFKPADPVDLATTIERYFASDLFLDLDNRRPQMHEPTPPSATPGMSSAKSLCRIYAELLGEGGSVGTGRPDSDTPDVSPGTHPEREDTTCLPKDNCRSTRH